MFHYNLKRNNLELQTIFYKTLRLEK